MFGFRLLNRVRGLGEGLNRRTIPQFQRMNRIKPQTNAHPNGPICHLKQNSLTLKGRVGMESGKEQSPDNPIPLLTSPLKGEER